MRSAPVTGAALVVGKAVLAANATRSIRRYDRAPLIRPILFKAAFYWAVVFVARLLEHWIRFWLVEHHPLGTFLPHMIATFDWHRFIAIQLWIFVLFLTTRQRPSSTICSVKASSGTCCSQPDHPSCRWTGGNGSSSASG